MTGEYTPPLISLYSTTVGETSFCVQVQREFLSLLWMLFAYLWVTASSSPEHNNVVVNKKHQADTLSQVKLHKKVRHSEAQGGLGGRGGQQRDNDKEENRQNHNETNILYF